MSPINYAVLLGAAASAVQAHSSVYWIRSGSSVADGFRPAWGQPNAKAPGHAGWTTTQTDFGYSTPDGTNSLGGTDKSNLICGRQATPGTTELQVAAGSKVDFLWLHEGASDGQYWPKSHHGPSLTYLAKCPGTSCTGVDKASLKFFKIAEEGLITGGASADSQTWATDKMMTNNGTITVTIPKELPNGAYVARHELIALHEADPARNKAQQYAHCSNLVVSGGSGTMNTDGVTGDMIYPGATDLAFNIYANVQSYPLPGPPLRTASGGGSGSPAPAPSSAAPAPAPSSSKAAAPSSTSRAPPSNPVPTTIQTSVRPAPTTAPGGGSGSGSGPAVPLPQGADKASIASWFSDLLNDYYS